MQPPFFDFRHNKDCRLLPSSSSFFFFLQPLISLRRGTESCVWFNLSSTFKIIKGTVQHKIKNTHFPTCRAFSPTTLFWFELPVCRRDVCLLPDIVEQQFDSNSCVSIKHFDAHFQENCIRNFVETAKPSRKNGALA